MQLLGYGDTMVPDKTEYASDWLVLMGKGKSSLKTTSSQFSSSYLTCINVEHEILPDNSCIKPTNSKEAMTSALKWYLIFSSKFEVAENWTDFLILISKNSYC